MKNNKSNTMELDTILAEARKRKGGSAASSKSASGQRSSGSSSKPAKSNISRSKPVYLETDSAFNDNFVLTDDDYTEYAPKPEKAPAAKKPQPKQAKQPPKPAKKKRTGLWVTLCIVLVLLVAGIAGVTMYLNSGSGTGPESTFSDNVYINGKPMKDLTMDQARQAMASVEQELANGIKITVKAGDRRAGFVRFRCGGAAVCRFGKPAGND